MPCDVLCVVLCMVLCVVLIIELLPMHSDSKYCPALENARPSLLLELWMLLVLMDLLFYYSRASWYATTSAASTKAFIAHCDSKGSFKGRYEQLLVLNTSSIKL